MITTLDSILDRLRVISSLFNDESAYIDNLYKGESTSAAEMLQKPCPMRHAMWAFLVSLPRHYLYAILTLMQAGRLEVEDLSAYSEQMISSFDEDRFAVEAIAEKIPRMRYIDAGLEYLKGYGSLEEFAEEIKKKL